MGDIGPNSLMISTVTRCPGKDGPSLIITAQSILSGL